jgi:hypothetical protein
MAQWMKFSGDIKKAEDSIKVTLDLRSSLVDQILNMTRQLNSLTMALPASMSLEFTFGL